MRSRSASTSGSPRSSAAAATSVSTTRTRRRRSRSTSTRSRPTSAGSASTGASISTTLRTISSSSTTGRSISSARARPTWTTSRPTRSATHRGTLTEPGRPSPWRDRSVDESLDLFARMRAGEFPDGARTLRARIDMASGNINLRDPVLYRILHASHPRTGDAWSIYPTYDFAHGQSDAIEGVTHSICTLEFADHRPLYDWLIENLPVPSRPRQYEFARLNLTHTVLSKRVLLRLVEEGRVRGWDDPRMPTISGLRRRGYPAEAIRDFAAAIGVSRSDSVVDIGVLEHAVRSVLNRTALRRFAVLRPLQARHRGLPRRPGRDPRRARQPRGPVRRHPSRAVLARAVDRARRLHGGPAQAVLPARARARGAPPLRVLRDLPRGRQGCVGRDRRAPLHVRPRHPRRRRPRRPPAEGDAPLAVGRARRPRRGAALRPPLRAPRPRGRGRPHGRPEPAIRGGAPGRLRRGRRGRGPGRAGDAVRATRVLHARPRHDARASRVRPDGDAQGHVGEGPGPERGGR